MIASVIFTRITCWQSGVKGRADHTQPSLGFSTIFVKLQSLVLLRLLRLLLLLAPIPRIQSIQIMAPGYWNLFHFSTDYQSYSCASSKGSIFNVPKGRHSCCSTLCSSVQPGQVLTESTRVLLCYLPSSQVPPCSL